jgi:hypothetical protein
MLKNFIIAVGVLVIGCGSAPIEGDVAKAAAADAREHRIGDVYSRPYDHHTPGFDQPGDIANFQSGRVYLTLIVTGEDEGKPRARFVHEMLPTAGAHWSSARNFGLSDGRTSERIQIASKYDPPPGVYVDKSAPKARYETKLDLGELKLDGPTTGHLELLFMGALDEMGKVKPDPQIGKAWQFIDWELHTTKAGRVVDSDTVIDFKERRVATAEPETPEGKAQRAEANRWLDYHLIESTYRTVPDDADHKPHPDFTGYEIPGSK